MKACPSTCPEGLTQASTEKLVDARLGKYATVTHWSTPFKFSASPTFPVGKFGLFWGTPGLSRKASEAYPSKGHQAMAAGALRTQAGGDLHLPAEPAAKMAFTSPASKGRSYRDTSSMTPVKYCSLPHELLMPPMLNPHVQSPRPGQPGAPCAAITPFVYTLR